MAERLDKQKRKELLAAAKVKARLEAQSQFPATNEIIGEFFDMLDHELSQQTCDHSLRLSTQWLNENGINIEPFLQWLRDNGGYCDCEALGNVEEHWREANHDVD